MWFFVIQDLEIQQQEHIKAILILGCYLTVMKAIFPPLSFISLIAGA